MRIVYLLVLISSPSWACLGGGGCCSTPGCGNPCGGGVGGYPSGPVSGGSGYIGTGGYGGVGGGSGLIGGGGSPSGYPPAPSYSPQSIPQSFAPANPGYSNGIGGGAIGAQPVGVASQVDSAPQAVQASNYNQGAGAQVAAATGGSSNSGGSILEPTGGATGTDYEIEYADEEKAAPSSNAQPVSSSYSEQAAVTSNDDTEVSVPTRPSTSIRNEVRPAAESPAPVYQPPSQLTPSGSQQIEDENEEPRLNYQASNNVNTAAQYVPPASAERIEAPIPSEDYHEEGNEQQEVIAIGSPERTYPTTAVPHAEVPASEEAEPTGFVSNLGEQIEAAEFGQTGVTPSGGNYPTENQGEQQVAADPTEAELPAGNEVTGDHDVSLGTRPAAESEASNEAPTQGQVVEGTRPSANYNVDTFENSQNDFDNVEANPAAPTESQQELEQNGTPDEASTQTGQFPELISQPTSREQIAPVDNEPVEVPEPSVPIQSPQVGPSEPTQSEQPIYPTQPLGLNAQPHTHIATENSDSYPAQQPPYPAESSVQEPPGTTQVSDLNVQTQPATTVSELSEPSLDTEASIDLKLSEPETAQKFEKEPENISPQSPTEVEIPSSEPSPIDQASGSISSGSGGTQSNKEGYSENHANIGVEAEDHEADLSPLESPTRAQIYSTTSFPITQSPQIEQNTVAPVEPYKNENIGEIITAHEQQIVPAEGYRPQPNAQPTVVDNTGGYNQIIRATKARTFGVRTKPEYKEEPYFFVIRK